MGTMKRERKSQSIFSSMIYGQGMAIFSAVIIALIFSSILYANYTYNEVTRKYIRLNETFALRLENQLDKPVQLLMMLDSVITLEDEGQNKDDKIGRMMKVINQSENLFENIEVIAQDGEIRSVFPEYSYLLQFDRSGESFFTNLADWTEIHWSDLSVSEISQQPSLRVTIRSQDVLLSGILNMDFIDEYCEEFHIENEDLGLLELSDRYGVFIFSSDSTKVSEHQIDPLLSFSDGDHADHDISGIRFVDGQWQLVTSRHIAGSGWHVTIKTSIFNAFRHGLIIMAGFSFFILLTLMIFGIITRRNAQVFSNHVNRLILQTRSVSEGNYESLPVSSKYRELQELTGHFDRMMNSIKSRDSQLHTIAFRDSLTSLYNRNYLNSQLIPQLVSSQDAHFALMIIDIDNFNLINDTIGHELGDELLISLSHRLMKYLPSNVHILRIGGDEFVLVVPITDERSIEQIIQLLDLVQNEPIICNERDIYITMSVGVSFHPDHGSDLNSLMRCADIAMHQAKKSGRGKVKVFDQEMSESVDRKLQVEQYLRTALANQEFHLVYQPQYSMDGKIVRGFEALLRWVHPILGNVVPLEFIPLAEDAQFIFEIEAWVLKQACLAIQQINALNKTEYIMAVNVSPTEFLNPKFITNVKSIIEESGINPLWLELEITENVSMGMHESILSQIHTLREFGVKVSMDDFGTGYSSLSYLSRFPIDLLKIDRSFISGIDQSPDKQAMVRMILALVRQLKIQALAEGVEREEEREVLASMSCDFVQGYLFSRPLMIEKILELMKRSE